MAAHTSSHLEDPCGEWGPTQRWALVWFGAILIVGTALTYRLATWDRWMYDNNGEFLDYSAYRQNRLSSTSLGSEPVDPRKEAGLLQHPPIAEEHSDH